VSSPRRPQSRRSARGAKPTKPASQQTDGTTNPEAPASGIGGVIAKNRRTVIVVASAAAFALLAVGSVYAGALYGSATKPEAVAQGTTAEGRPTLAEIPPASRLRTCSVSSIAKDGALGKLKAAVINASTGELLFDRSATKVTTVGSQEQLFTAAAALNILGKDDQFATRVYDGTASGTIVLYGSGDPTITALDSGDSVYKGAGRLQDLADQVLASYEEAHPGVEISNIILDANLWDPKDSWNTTWSPSAISGGTLSKITALQVDGDRANPTAKVSPRSTDPVGRAGALFAAALGKTVTFADGRAVQSNDKLGEIKSQKVSVLINQMLSSGDKTLAEYLGRAVSVTGNFGGTTSSVGDAIASSLGLYDLDGKEVQLKDGSGLSTSNKASPKFMADFMSRLRDGNNDLNIIYNSLSTMGKSGALSSRLAGKGAAGHVFARAGTGSSLQSLVGTIEAKDGTPLTFAIYATGKGVGSTSSAAIDKLVSAFYSCGDNLSNN
jgi:serine-type D-Ala-D-Ala carboxypeptidase/endopeptidase (penicillin-binding protein 4)